MWINDCLLTTPWIQIHGYPESKPVQTGCFVDGPCRILFKGFLGLLSYEYRSRGLIHRILVENERVMWINDCLPTTPWIQIHGYPESKPVQTGCFVDRLCRILFKGFLGLIILWLESKDPSGKLNRSVHWKVVFPQLRGFKSTDTLNPNLFKQVALWTDCAESFSKDFLVNYPMNWFIGCLSRGCLSRGCLSRGCLSHEYLSRGLIHRIM